MALENLGLDVDKPSVLAVQKAAEAFLAESLPDVQRVNIVKLVPIDPYEGTWEVEAEVFQPNETITSLGIETQRPVLDKTLYLVRLDRALEVQAYGLSDSVTTQQ